MARMKSPADRDERHAEGAHKARIGVPVLSDEQRTQAVALLAATTRPSYAEIGRAVGVHWQVIQRLDRKTRPQIEDAQRTLAEYQRRLPKALPIRERVEILAKIARKADSNPFAAQRALEQINELEGLRALAKKREAEARESHICGPLFVLNGSIDMQPVVPEPLEKAGLRYID